MLEIDTANRIILDGKSTGLALSQQQACTLVYTPEGLGHTFRPHPMPQSRYSTSHDEPGSGVAGRAQLEADVRALLANLRG